MEPGPDHIPAAARMGTNDAYAAWFTPQNHGAPYAGGHEGQKYGPGGDTALGEPVFALPPQ